MNPLKVIWDNCIDEISSIIQDEEKIVNFYLTSQLLDFRNQVAVIGVETDLDKNVLNKDLDVIRDCLSKVSKVECRKVTIDLIESNNINCFENFVVDESNRQAYEICKEVADNRYQSKTNGLICLYGSNGLGKTHLLNSIRNRVKEIRNNTTIIYESGYSFLEYFINHVKQRRYEFMRYRYTSCDILLIDDFHSLILKEKSSNMLFDIIKERNTQSKITVLACDDKKIIQEIKSEDIRTLIKQSKKVSINTPSKSALIKIIKYKLSNYHLTDQKISDAAIDYLATKYVHDVREAEGIINKIFFVARVNNIEEITLLVAKKIVNDLNIQPYTEITVSKIISFIANYYRLPIEKVIQRNNDKKSLLARQVSIYVIRNELGLSYAEIGKVFQISSSTIRTNYKKVQTLMQDDEFKTRINMLIDTIKSK